MPEGDKMPTFQGGGSRGRPAVPGALSDHDALSLQFSDLPLRKYTK